MMKKVHHEDGCEQCVHAVCPDTGAVHEAGEERQLGPEEGAVLAAEDDLEVTLCKDRGTLTKLYRQPVQNQLGSTAVMLRCGYMPFLQ